MRNIPIIRRSDVKAGAKCTQSDIIMAKTDGPVGCKAQYTNIFGETFTEGEQAYYLPGYEDPEVVVIKRKADGRWYAQPVTARETARETGTSVELYDLTLDESMVFADEKSAIRRLFTLATDDLAEFRAMVNERRGEAEWL